MTANKPKNLVLVFMIILALTLLVQLLGLSYTTSQAGGSFRSVVIPSTTALSIFTLVTAGPGLYLGRKIGLGVPRLDAILTRQAGAWRDLIADVKIAFPTGIVLGLLLVGLRYVLSDYLPSELPEFGFRGFWGGALISASAAIGEEVWFRLGMMTILVWLASKIFNQESPSPTIIWSILVMVSFVFGMAHFPHLASQDAANPAAMFGTLSGNVAVSIFYGWLFWKRGLLAAMIAHFSVDLGIHALPALF